MSMMTFPPTLIFLCLLLTILFSSFLNFFSLGFLNHGLLFFSDVYIFVCASTRWGQVLTKAQRTRTLFSLELPGVTVVVVNLTLWMMELNSGLWKSNSCFSGHFLYSFSRQVVMQASYVSDSLRQRLALNSVFLSPHPDCTHVRVTILT